MIVLSRNEIRSWLARGKVDPAHRALELFACDCCRRVLHAAYHAGKVASPDGGMTADVCCRCARGPDWFAAEHTADTVPVALDAEPERSSP